MVEWALENWRHFNLYQAYRSIFIFELANNGRLS